MMQNLYDELSKIDLKYHELGTLKEDVICITAKTLDPEGIDEVMRIKVVADRFHMHTIWDGQNVEIIWKK